MHSAPTEGRMRRRHFRKHAGRPVKREAAQALPAYLENQDLPFWVKQLLLICD
ncbi:hypothetical protein KIL84_017209 [Mauremys mutica]|uniref:Uncharacterized protein n=1 Tax=Mauremys mutica TaxID=74926 RepID=A0A9D4AYG0_9SAUR|nr:hypothetical protein KIL84_017209 [Mauremys mutica]